MKTRGLTIGCVLSLVLVAQVELATAVPSYQAASSTATFIHDPDLGVAGVPALSATLVGTGTLASPSRSNPKTFSPLTTMPTPASYQFATTDTRPAGAGNSVAKASVAHVTNNTTAAVKIASGTGVTQTSNVATAYNGASEMRINVDLKWTITSTNTFGPPASGLASYAVGGKVGAGAGSFAQFESFLEFLDPLNPGTSYRSPITLTDTWMRGDADVAADGTFSKLFSDTALINLPTASLPAGSQLQLKGYILFRARSLPATTALAGAFTGDLAAADESLNSAEENGKNKEKDEKDKNQRDGKDKNKDKDKGKDKFKSNSRDEECEHEECEDRHDEECDEHEYDPCEQVASHPGRGIGHDPDHFKGNGNRYGWHRGHAHSSDGCPPGGLDLETFVGFPQEQILGGAQVFGEAVPEPMTVALGSMGTAALALAAIRRRRA